MQTIFKHRIFKNVRRQYHISEIRIHKQPSRYDNSPQQTSKSQLGSGHAPRMQNVNKELCVIRDCATGTVISPGPGKGQICRDRDLEEM